MGLINSLRGLFGGGESGAPECVACGSKQVTMLASDAYRCDGCGYEGGDGYAAYQAVAERAVLRGVDDEALLARVREGLESARLSLVALSGSRQTPELSRGWRIAVGIGSEVLGADLLEVGAEEREQIRLERERLVNQACADLVGLRPALEVLSERGRPVGPFLESLDLLATSGEPGAGLAAELLGQIGEALFG